MKSHSYEELNKAWKSVCRAVLGDEIGELEEYSNYLKKYSEPVREEKSFLSGKLVHVSEQDYYKGASFIGFSEVGEYLEKIGNTPFDISKVKGLDSAINAIRHKAIYTGDAILGNSGECVACDRCSNTYFALQAHDLSDSKFCAYACLSRVCSYYFGSGFSGECSYGLQFHYGFKAVRIFECLRMFNCSDCYFSAGLEDCQDCIYCFNLKNRRYCIGNLQLGKEEYTKTKERLLSQVRSELMAKKDIQGVVELIAHGNFNEKEQYGVQRGVEKTPYFGKGKAFPAVIEEGFRNTTRILFGKELSGISQYEKWLMRHVRCPPKMKSAASGKVMYNVPMLAFARTTKSCITLEEADKVAKGSMKPEDIPKLSIENAAELLSGIICFTPDAKLGENQDVDECVDFANSADCWRGSSFWYSKCCAYSFWTRNSECAFGTDLSFYSKFCLKCYNSQYLTRCFEVNGSLKCSDCYFCQNCEGLENCMFCFNAKSLRYAIGNVEYPKEEYLKLKKIILAEIAGRLEKDKALPISIFSIGAAKGAE